MIALFRRLLAWYRWHRDVSRALRQGRERALAADREQAAWREGGARAQLQDESDTRTW